MSRGDCEQCRAIVLNRFRILKKIKIPPSKIQFFVVIIIKLLLKKPIIIGGYRQKSTFNKHILKCNR